MDRLLNLHIGVALLLESFEIDHEDGRRLVDLDPLLALDGPLASALACPGFLTAERVFFAGLIKTIVDCNAAPPWDLCGYNSKRLKHDLIVPTHCASDQAPKLAAENVCDDALVSGEVPGPLKIAQ